jgi:hypothetical protein
VVEICTPVRVKILKNLAKIQKQNKISKIRSKVKKEKEKLYKKPIKVICGIGYERTDLAIV